MSGPSTRKPEELVHVVPEVERGTSAGAARARALTSLVSRNGAVAVLVLGGAGAFFAMKPKGAA